MSESLDRLREQIAQLGVLQMSRQNAEMHKNVEQVKADLRQPLDAVPIGDTTLNFGRTDEINEEALERVKQQRRAEKEKQEEAQKVPEELPYVFMRQLIRFIRVRQPTDIQHIRDFCKEHYVADAAQKRAIRYLKHMSVIVVDPLNGNVLCLEESTSFPKHMSVIVGVSARANRALQAATNAIGGIANYANHFKEIFEEFEFYLVYLQEGIMRREMEIMEYKKQIEDLKGKLQNTHSLWEIEA